MRILLIVLILMMLCGCETVGEIVREKKYAFDVYETENAKHKFGYNDDHEYVGYIVKGQFGKKTITHHHSTYCIHSKYKED